MRAVLHFLIAMVGSVTWVVSMLFMALTTWIAVVGHKVHPRARHGNCWTYALPRFALHGGYLQIRMTDRPRLFGRRIIPHAQWVRSLHPDTELRQTDPVRRRVRLHEVWRTFYFEYRVVDKEPHPRRSDWGGL